MYFFMVLEGFFINVFYQNLVFPIIWWIFSTFPYPYFCTGNEILILLGLIKLWISDKSWLAMCVLKPKKLTLVASFYDFLGLLFWKKYFQKSSITSRCLQLRLRSSGFEFFEYFSLKLKLLFKLRILEVCSALRIINSSPNCL